MGGICSMNRGDVIVLITTATILRMLVYLALWTALGTRFAPSPRQMTRQGITFVLV
jgi:hypothetical protein